MATLFFCKIPTASSEYLATRFLHESRARSPGVHAHAQAPGSDHRCWARRLRRWSSFLAWRRGPGRQKLKNVRSVWVWMCFVFCVASDPKCIRWIATCSQSVENNQGYRILSHKECSHSGAKSIPCEQKMTSQLSASGTLVRCCSILFLLFNRNFQKRFACRSRSRRAPRSSSLDPSVSNCAGTLRHLPRATVELSHDFWKI